jgi:hypothetical protein
MSFILSILSHPEGGGVELLEVLRTIDIFQVGPGHHVVDPQGGDMDRILVTQLLIAGDARVARLVRVFSAAEFHGHTLI